MLDAFGDQEKIEVRCRRCGALVAVDDPEAPVPEHEMRAYPGERCAGAGPGDRTGRVFLLTVDGRLLLQHDGAARPDEDRPESSRPA